MNPANVNFGNPNDNPTTFPAEMPKEQQIQQPQQQQDQSQDKKDKSSSGITVDEIFKFLNKNVNTILTFSIAIAIGFAFKDFMNDLVIYILQPSMMLLIMTIDKNNYLPITESLREKNISINIPKFLGSMLILKLVIGSMFLVNKYSNLLF
jgi:flagellar biosynthesis/type III secretory pathway M-ring protein FliF/YscJ